MREVIKHLHHNLRASAFCTGVFLCLLFGTSAFADEGQLKGVKQEISRQQNQVTTNRNKVDQLQKSLRQQEVGIADTAKAIHQAEQRSDELDTSIRSLRQQLEQLRQQQLGQQELLKELLNAHYKQGKQSQLALMLSGEDSSQLDRFTTYAERLSQARSHALDELAATTTELQLKQHQLSEQQQEQQALLAKLIEQKRKLESERNQRQKTVKNLRSQLTTDNQYLAELKENEQRLVKEIEKARAAAEAARRVPMDGLAKQKGKLPWPVKGKILHSYGTSQQGELHWKGMVIAQSTGSPVKAIYPGKVVFADWLRGYGLVLAVDHGKGDMSFYGYNQTLLKKVGETVQANESIALIGDSGGQEQSSLYFEIRRKGSPTNPKAWLTK